MIKFARASAQHLVTPDAASLAYPNSDWCLSWVMRLDGTLTGDNPQYVVSNGNFGAAGTLNSVLNTASSASHASKVVFYLNTNAAAQAPNIVSTSVFNTPNQERLFVLQRSGTTLTLRSAPILTIAPVDGSAVVAEGSTTLNIELNGPAGMYVAARADLLAARFNDQSLSRIFRFDGTLTDLEVANLAYGKEITEIGKSPSWYLPMADASDITNEGTNGSVFTAVNSPTTSAEPAYGWTGGVVPVDAVDVTDITANRIFQRSSGAATIPLSGVYTGTTPVTIEAQVYAADGTTVISAWSAITSPIIAGGTWIGNRSVPEGGMYRIAVRSKEAGGSVIAASTVKSNLWGVGALIGIIGSSSAEKLFDSSSGTGKTPSATVRKFNESGWTTFATVGAGIDFANDLTSQLGVPVGFLDYGISGTTLAQWVMPGYAGFTAFTSGISSVGGKLEAIYSTLGSNDAATGIVVSQDAHIANLNLLASNTKTILGQPNIKWIGSGTNGRTSGNNQQFNWVREAEKEVFSQPNFSYTQTIDLQVSGDNVHLTAAGFTASVLRSAAILSPVLLGNTPRKAPAITSIVYSGSSADVNIAYQGGSTDFTPTSGITGFTATDASGALTITSAVRSSATKIVLTFNRAVVAPIDVDYLSGARPIVTNPVLDNGALPLPLDLELELAANPVLPDIVTVRINGELIIIDPAFVLSSISSGSIIPAIIGNKITLLRPEQII